MKSKEEVSSIFTFRRLSILLLFAVIAMSAVSILNVKHVHLGYDIEKFFSPDDPSVKFYESFREEFENENDYLIVGLTNDQGVFEESFLKKVDELTAFFQADTNIRRVYSPTNATRQLKSPFGSYTSIPAIHVDEPIKYIQDKNQIQSSNDHISSLFSPNGNSVRLVLKLNAGIDQKAGFALLTQYKQKVETFHFDDAHFAGRMETQNYYIKEMQSEMTLFVGLALAIVILSLILVMKSIRYSLLSLLTIFLATLSTFGVIGILGIEINLMLILMPAILLIIGASSSIHFFSDVSHNLTQYATKEEAIRAALRNTGLPILFNSLTTSAGFLSLTLIPVRPIQSFGFLTGVGILIVFIFLLAIGIASSSILPKPSKGVRPMIQLPRIKLFRKKGIVGGVLLLGLMIIGSFSFNNLNISNHFLEDLQDDSSLKESLTFFESNFGGIRPFEVVVVSKSARSIEDIRFLKDLEGLEKKIEETYETKYVISPLNLVRTINRSIHADNRAYYALPKSEKELNKISKVLAKKEVQKKTKSLISNLGVRFSARVKDYGSKMLAKKNAELLSSMRYNYPDLKLTFTGAAHLMDRANSKLATSLIYGLGLAILISLFCIFLITKSIRISLLSLIPNILPLLFAISVMWFFNIPLNMGSAMIFSIVFGLAVDDTLHFVFKYHQLKKTYTSSSIPRTIIHLRRPMVGTSIVLGFGFLVFGLSGFTSISFMGIIVGLSMFVALITDFYLLPILLGVRLKK